MSTETEFEFLAFATAKEWEKWLSQFHRGSNGVWLRFFKKDSKIRSVSHADALACALCYGWIDGQLKKLDEKSWVHKFTPRRSKSVWSKRNREIVEQLAKAGKMKPAGFKEMEAAKADGRWDRAYDSPSTMTVPEDFLKSLAKNKKARSFFETLNKANIYAITWRLQTAKQPGTRDRRMREIIEMLAAGKQFHEPRRQKKKTARVRTN